MQLKDLPAKLRELLSQFMQAIKGLKELPHFWKYIFLAFFSTLLFIVITFPYDSLITRQLHQYEGKAFRTASIKDIKFSFFGNTVLDDVYFVLNNNDEIELKNLIIAINKNPWKLFYKKNIVTDFQIRGFKYLSSKFDAAVNFNGNADLIISNKGALPVEGWIKLLISNAVLKLNEVTFQGPLGPMTLKIGTIQISAVNCDLDMASGVINISRFEVTGDDLSGSVSGNIKPENFLPGSSLNLTVNVNPDSAVLSEYKNIVQSLVKNNTLTFYVKGTFAKPNIGLTPGD